MWNLGASCSIIVAGNENTISLPESRCPLLDISNETRALSPFGYLCIHTNVCICIYIHIYMHIYTYAFLCLSHVKLQRVYVIAVSQARSGYMCVWERAREKKRECVRECVWKSLLPLSLLTDSHYHCSMTVAGKDSGGRFHEYLCCSRDFVTHTFSHALSFTHSLSQKYRYLKLPSSSCCLPVSVTLTHTFSHTFSLTLSLSQKCRFLGLGQASCCSSWKVLSRCEPCKLLHILYNCIFIFVWIYIYICLCVCIYVYIYMYVVSMRVLEARTYI